jgi:capsular polysaccharide biosynthesis protein
MDSVVSHIVLLRPEFKRWQQVTVMENKVEEIKENALAIQNGLRSIGANRAVALSVHVSKEVIAEMEERIARLIDQLDNL